MDPSGPAQPGLDTVYTAADNPVDQNPQEQYEADVNAKSNTGSLVEAREHGDIPVPSQYIEDATPSSLGYGVRDAKNDAGSKISAGVSNTEAEQMRAPGEGEVYKAQFEKTGFGEQDDLASDLDRKKAEQASLRENTKKAKEEETDVGGVLGQRGGPAVVEGR